MTRNESWWLYRHFFDAFSLMLIGMVLLRTGVVTAERSARTYALMVLLGYGVGLTVNYLEVAHVVSSDFSVLSCLEAGITSDLGRLPMTVSSGGTSCTMWSRRYGSSS